MCQCQIQHMSDMETRLVQRMSMVHRCYPFPQICTITKSFFYEYLNITKEQSYQKERS